MTTDTHRELQMQLAQVARELDDGRNQREITTRAVDQATGAVHDGISDQWQKIVAMLQRRAADRANGVPVAWNEESEAEVSANAAIHGFFAGATSALGRAGSPPPRQADRYAVGRAPQDDPHPFAPREDEDPDLGWSR